MPIRYKVVKKKSRMSAVVNGNSKYAIKYIPGTTVMANPITLGIMTFKRRHQAEKFAYRINGFPAHWTDQPKYIIIAVETIGQGKYPYEISHGYASKDLDLFYKDTVPIFLYMSTVMPPDGTMCYPGVKVLE